MVNSGAGCGSSSVISMAADGAYNLGDSGTTVGRVTVGPWVIPTLGFSMVLASQGIGGAGMYCTLGDLGVTHGVCDSCSITLGAIDTAGGGGLAV